MARYSKDYSGEKRTEKITIQLTKSELEAFRGAADEAGVRSLSEHGRNLCLRRQTAGQVVAGTRRDPVGHAIVNELIAIGNNINQIARVSNTYRAVPQLAELTSVTELLRVAISRVIDG